ncbi:hypothetical protein [Pseudoalteromonas sp. NBT06-2]|uniref:hypothetical protein n=1 Tax=Pseudoalteromonas sp. NBT06-2 TaxID=2025950 RepID=UPI001140B935|nr:hypothetical protein [Pseudoalteromonas sp. NBT06-2]
MLVVAGPSYFKETTINTKMRLDHELLSSPGTRILKWLGYNKLIQLCKISFSFSCLSSNVSWTR